MCSTLILITLANTICITHILLRVGYVDFHANSESNFNFAPLRQSFEKFL